MVRTIPKLLRNLITLNFKINYCFVEHILIRMINKNLQRIKKKHEKRRFCFLERIYKTFKIPKSSGTIWYVCKCFHQDLMELGVKRGGTGQ